MGVRDIYRDRDDLGAIPQLRGFDRGLYFGRDTDASLLTNLVAYYRLGDVNPSFSGTALINYGTATFDAGKWGNGANMGASNTTKALYAPKALIATTATPHSVSCWFKINTLPTSTTQQVIFSNDIQRGSESITINKSGANYQLIFYRYFISGNEGYQEVKSNFAADTTSWFHVILTYDATNLKGYLNGGNTGSVAAAVGPYSGPYSAGCFILGVGTHWINPGPGVAEPGTDMWGSTQIDEVGIWNKCLSANEIADLYNDGLGNPLLGSPLP